MRLLCLHADTVEALQRLGTSVEDLTPNGLWDSPYHLVTVSADQRDALQRLRVTMDDVTPTALRDGAAAGATAQTAPRAPSGVATSDAVASPS
jgi:hypothetical protein